jgi:UDP-2,3-diacylglucosamine hydrolase
MTAMKRLIIADAHLGQSPGDIEEMCALIDRAADRVGEICYLGDAFQYLIGMSKFWTVGVRRVMNCWRTARAKGVRIGVVEGNRDFFLDEADLTGEIDWAGRRYDFTAGERHFRLVHGDLVNRRDFQYRFWSKVSKCGVARLWARLLPRPVAVTIVRRMEARLATTNRKFRYVKPIVDLEKCAVKAWKEGVDVLFWGHFHTAWECRQGDRLALIIPAWLETRCSVLVEPDGAWSFVDSRLEPAEPRTEP